MSEAMSRRGLLKAGAGFAAATAVAGVAGGRPALAEQGRFNLASPSYSILWQNKLHEVSGPQSFAFDNVNGHIYAIQVQWGNGTVERGDLVITKMTLTGTELGYMVLKGFGHGVSMAVEPVGNQAYMWTETDSQLYNGDGYGTAIARFPFQNGRTLQAREVTDKYTPVPGATIITPSIDPTLNRITVQYWRNGAKPYHYSVYNLADFKARRFDNPVYRFVEPQLGPADAVLQGWTTYREFLYVLDGNLLTGAPGNTYITCVDMRTAQVVHRSFSQAGISLDRREAEGMAIQLVNGTPRLCFGFGSGASGARRLSVFYKDAWM
ncbi:hypothetical protein [Nonomuraea longicatena]|uniref:P68 RBP/TagC-like beta-propeller domain-containing protein n=1 Tax=Nonomuraea longicatena TaxID=83682 RepID=A0ABP3Z3W3_9ACTN